jgi:GTPase SAR1 family protein
LVPFKVRDIGGQSISSTNLCKYIAGTDGVFLVYDTTNSDSLLNLSDWLHVVRSHASSSGSDSGSGAGAGVEGVGTGTGTEGTGTRKELRIYLLGNKIDLISARQVTQEAHTSFIAEHGLSGGMWVSARSGEALMRCFYMAAMEVAGLPVTEQDLAVHDKVYCMIETSLERHSFFDK